MNWKLSSLYSIQIIQVGYEEENMKWADRAECREVKLSCDEDEQIEKTWKLVERSDQRENAAMMQVVMDGKIHSVSHVSFILILHLFPFLFPRRTLQVWFLQLSFKQLWKSAIFLPVLLWSRACSALLGWQYMIELISLNFVRLCCQKRLTSLRHMVS